MIDPPIDDARARLELNSRAYRPDRDLDRVADMLESGDRDALEKLPPRFVDLASIQMDLRRMYRDAVRLGAITDRYSDQ